MINDRGFFEKSRDPFESETFTETKEGRNSSSFVDELSIIVEDKAKKRTSFEIERVRVRE